MLRQGVQHAFRTRLIHGEIRGRIPRKGGFPNAKI